MRAGWMGLCQLCVVKATEKQPCVVLNHPSDCSDACMSARVDGGVWVMLIGPHDPSLPLNEYAPLVVHAVGAAAGLGPTGGCGFFWMSGTWPT